MSLFSLKIIQYYTCDVGGIEAARSYTIDAEDIDKLRWPDLVRQIIDRIRTDVKDMPVNDLRLMTEDEVDAYKLEKEEDERAGGVTVDFVMLPNEVTAP